MGNTLGRKKRSVKVMKVDGETIKFKTPVRAGLVLLNHPSHVLLESEAVKQYGTQAKPLEPLHELKPSRLYFLVQLPEDKNPRIRRMRSATHTSAKDRLESLKLRRSSSDVSTRKSTVDIRNMQETAGGVRVRMRLPKAEVERLMSESSDAAEVAEKIAGLYRAAGGEEKVDIQAPVNHQKRVGFLSNMTEAESIHLAMAS